MRNFIKKNVMYWLPVVALMLCAIPAMAQEREEIHGISGQALGQSDLLPMMQRDLRTEKASSSSRRISKQKRADATPGTATSPYLDISKYASIDDAIWKTDDNEKFYKYTEDNGIGWLSIPVYSAFDVVNSNYNEENCQRWIDYSGIENDEGKEIIYSLILNETWEEASPFAGGDYYFGEKPKLAYGLYTTDDQYYNTEQQNIVFYVTNCTAIQLFGHNTEGVVQGSWYYSHNYPAILNVYECTNNNGTLTASNTASASTQNYEQDTNFTLSVNGLDPTAIYKVVAGVYCSYLFEIAFQTVPEIQGSALGSYLDIEKYKTIDVAGWSTSLVNNLYQFTEDETNDCDWLTLPVYGAFVGAKYATNATRSNQINSGHPQKWIETNLISTDGAYTGIKWSTPTDPSPNPFKGYLSYFTSATACAMGNNSKTSESPRNVTFCVTNITEVQLYSKYANVKTNDSNPNFFNKLEVTECEESNGTITPIGSTLRETFSTKDKDGVITITNLDPTKIYKVAAIVYRGYLYEIAFKKPRKPVLTATPETLEFSCEKNPEEAPTGIINLKGKNLKGDVTVTISGAPFSIEGNVTSISKNEASEGKDITIIFNPTRAGEFNGTVTFSSSQAENEVVNLHGVASDYHEVTIGQYGLTTLYYDQALQIPYDRYLGLLGVFYAKESTGKELRMKQIPTNIPANEGVVVQGNSGTYRFPIISSDGVAELNPENLLTGTVEANGLKTADVLADNPGCIVMTLAPRNDNYIGFYKYTGNKLGQYKAFLIYNPGSNANINVLSMSGISGGEFTGIQDINVQENDDAWYTLQGVRLNGTPKQRGIYIRKGKTVVVK